MLATFANAWKVNDIRKKLLYILFILLIFRVGSVIPVPGLDMEALQQGMFGDFGILGMLVGGEMGTIFALGIGPYITASIIMQLLTFAIPRLSEMKKEGAEGTKKINQITRILALVMAVLQAIAFLTMWRGAFIVQDNLFLYGAAVVTMVAGTMFIMWMSELLTEKGLGNGASFIILANILSSLPGGVIMLYNASTISLMNAIFVVIILASFVFMVAFTVIISEGQRKLPVQYSKKMVGRQNFGGQSSFIPVKVNLAGVLPIIFAMSVLGFPGMLTGFFPNAAGLNRVAEVLSVSSPIGAPIFIVLIFAFTFFYASFSINPTEMAENLKKNGGFMPGIRPGKPTGDFIQRTVSRMSWIGAASYAAIAVMPIVMEWIFGIPVGFGGTTIIIVVGVALDLVKKLESQLLMRNYKGFLNE